MKLHQKTFLLVLTVLISDNGFAAEKDKYIQNGKICYYRSGKYAAEVCRKPKDGEDISQYPVRQFIQPNQSAQTKKNSGIPDCETVYWQKYYQTLGEAIQNPSEWQLEGYNSPKEYAQARARLWLSLVQKQYKGCE
jgi:hypothetical protein